MLNKAIIDRGIKLQGQAAQFDHTMEECGELIVAISHFFRNRIEVEDLVQEIVDVRMMCDMLQTIIEEDYSKGKINIFKTIEEEKIVKNNGQLDKLEGLYGSASK